MRHYIYTIPSLAVAFCLSGIVSAWCVSKRVSATDDDTENKLPPTCWKGMLVAYFCAVFVMLFFYPFSDLSNIGFFFQSLLFLWGPLPFLIFGSIDDKIQLSSSRRFQIFLLIAFLQFIQQAPFYYFIGRNEENSWLIIYAFLLPASFWFFSNAYNSLGKDEGCCEIAFLGLAFTLPFLDFAGDDFSLLLGLILGAAVFGILVWNFIFNSKISLGNGGGLFLGACATSLFFPPFQSYSENPSLSEVCMFFTVFAFPVYDFCTSFILRIAKELSWQDHYSHRLLRGGFPLWLVNLIAFTAAGILPVLFIKISEGAIYFGPFAVWAFLLFLDVLAAFLCWKKSGNH